MNNAVRDWQGHIIGFRCFECGDVVHSMWGTVCNGCREKERRHQELLQVLLQRRRTATARGNDGN